MSNIMTADEMARSRQRWIKSLKDDYELDIAEYKSRIKELEDAIRNHQKVYTDSDWLWPTKHDLNLYDVLNANGGQDDDLTST